jgi:hypothetical protein
MEKQPLTLTIDPPKEKKINDICQKGLKIETVCSQVYLLMTVQTLLDHYYVHASRKTHL